MRTVVRSGFLLLVADEDQGENVVVLTGRAEVRGIGPAVVDGRVQNGVIALNGDVRVSGVVENNVVALDGRVVVAESGRLQGDGCRATGPWSRAAGASTASGNDGTRGPGAGAWPTSPASPFGSRSPSRPWSWA